MTYETIMSILLTLPLGTRSLALGLYPGLKVPLL